MKVFQILGFTKKLVFDSSTSVTKLNMFSVCFIDGSRFVKEYIACQAFEAFSRVAFYIRVNNYNSFLRITFL